MSDHWLNYVEETVCFTGHRFIPAAFASEIRNRLNIEILKAYEKGYRRFICGGAIGFDTLAAQSVIAFRKDHPDVRLLLALPCGDQDENWNGMNRDTYQQIVAAADDVIVLTEKYYRGCMQNRNRYMVDHSSMCIAWLTKLNGSGTLYTVRYALQKDLKIVNLAIWPEST